MGMIPDKDLPGPYFFREYTLVLDSPSRRSLMERTLEEIARVAASPESVIGLLSTDPAAALTGMSSPDTRLFAAEMAVELGGGTSLVHEVDVTFERRPDGGGRGCFALSWRARDHQRAFPVFWGDLEVHPDGNGSELRLSGHYSLPLGAVGAFSDRLLGHRAARRSIQGFLEVAAARIDAALSHASGRELEAGVEVTGPRTASTAVPADKVPSELYLG
jgi:hypothetical protein